MDTINFTQARKNFSSVLDQVVESNDYTVITRREKPDAVVMSLEYFNSLMETLHLMSSPANAERLLSAIAQHKQGAGEARDLIDV